VAGRLGSDRNRTRLYYALRHAVEVATGAHPPLIATRLCRQAIQDSGPLGVQGLAIAARLVDDPGSPLYRERARQSLAASLLEA
jgi:hypothetical protein